MNFLEGGGRARGLKEKDGREGIWGDEFRSVQNEITEGPLSLFFLVKRVDERVGRRLPAGARPPAVAEEPGDLVLETHIVFLVEVLVLG